MNLVLFLLACISLARLGAAEISFRRTPRESKTAAAAGRAEYFEQWAERASARRGELLARAVALNPYDSAAWIALGFAAERQGRLDQAAADLAMAERVDKQFIPAWTLANFFYRRSDPANTWRMLARAAALCDDDLRPVIAAADRLDEDPLQAMERLGASPRLRRSYLDFEISRSRWNAALEIAGRMLENPAAEDAPRLADLVDRLIAEGRGEEAWRIWNGFTRAFPGQNDSYATDLRDRPSGHGFDWRMNPENGAAVHWEPFRLVISFSGFEAGRQVLVERWVLANAPRYRLEFDYRTEAMPAAALRWVVGAAAGTSQGPYLESEDRWSHFTWDFQPTAAGLQRMQLVYQRQPQTGAASWRIELRRIRLENI